MRISGRRVSLGLIGLAALPALSCCGRIAHIDCDQIAASARALSQDRPIRIESIANVREMSRNETEMRCIGDATLADGGTAPLYMRAREENENVVVAYQGVPYP